MESNSMEPNNMGLDNDMNDFGDMGGGDNSEEKSYDNDFDAGVEADEDSDPKRYIQQLTGKLSQKLRDYNESMGETDSDLNKYVAGMIVKQAVNGLDTKDRSEIIKKINDDSQSDDSVDDIGDDSSNDMDDNADNELPIDNEMPTEGKNIICTKKQLKNLSETFNNLIDNNDEKRVEKKILKNTKLKGQSKPFKAPNFK